VSEDQLSQIGEAVLTKGTSTLFWLLLTKIAGHDIVSGRDERDLRPTDALRALGS